MEGEENFEEGNIGILGVIASSISNPLGMLVMKLGIVLYRIPLTVAANSFH
jgi:hypothetical protein